jgi:uncharacterized protein (DUF885 family)
MTFCWCLTGSEGGIQMKRLVLALFPVLLLAQTDTEKLHKIFDEEHAEFLREFPQTATWNYGRQPGPGRWNDQSMEAHDRRREQTRARLGALRALNPDSLSRADRFNYDLLVNRLQEQVDFAAFPAELLALTNRFASPAYYLPQALNRAPAETVADYEKILDLLRGVPARLEQQTALLRRGVHEGIVLPDIAVRAVPSQLDTLTAADPARSPLLSVFRRFPKNIPPAEQDRLAKEANAILDAQVIPALRKFRTYAADQYLPRTTKNIARSSLPNGKAWYAAEVRRETTTTMTPEEIHALGLAEVKRIRGEMEAIVTKTGFQGSFAAFVEFLRTDPRFYFTRAEDMMMAVRDLCKRIDPEVPRLFGRLPRTPYGVREMPAVSAPTASSALYDRPGGTRPGWFSVNTYKLETRPKYELEALALHEAVPGHHLQLSLEREIVGVPKFRARFRVTAFSEGWGLYAESLGDELGFYRDPYSKFGQLSMEIWRACRLVVDTGMHSLGWPRQKAIDFMKENTGLSEHIIVAEIDRYIDNPAQALSYKIGELKFKELRKLAEKELGPRFDIRAFHDTVLANGSIPLVVLEAEVRRWIAETKSRP